MGLPVLTNAGVGDVAQIVQESGAGVLIERFDKQAYRSALLELKALPRSGLIWRENARRWFDLDAGIERYDMLYRHVATDLKTSTRREECEASE
jgi:glycosyltransferase involved in cell wall biosynthesis